MTKPFDITKFRKSITKNIDGVSTGFNDPTTWIHTGSYALNYLISGNFYKGVPLSKFTMFAGESGSGKSFVCSGNIVRNAQKQGIFCVLIDTENALDEDWLKAIGVDTSEDKLLRISAAMVDEVAKTISDFMKNYKDEYGGLEPEEQPEVLFVIDSLGMLLTPTDLDQFQKGDMKGDMGRKAKSLMALVKNTLNQISQFNVGVVATNHTYASQDMFDPEDKISGGQGPIYASSIVVAMKKLKLKEGSDVTGIRAACKVMKSRYSKPHEKAQLSIPYETGMDPYSGVFDIFLDKNLIEKQGNRYKYITNDGEELFDFRKRWTDEMLDKVMSEYMENLYKKKESQQDPYLEDESENEDENDQTHENEQ